MIGGDFTGHRRDALRYQTARQIIPKVIVERGAAADVGKQDRKFFYLMRHDKRSGSAPEKPCLFLMKLPASFSRKTKFISLRYRCWSTSHFLLFYFFWRSLCHHFLILCRTAMPTVCPRRRGIEIHRDKSNAAHHEEHKDHEDFSIGYVRPNAHPSGAWRFCDTVFLHVLRVLRGSNEVLRIKKAAEAAFLF
jgi:hypothetical protein